MSVKDANKNPRIVIISTVDTQSDTDTATIVKDKTTVDMPRKYNIVMHNDDYTPMGFVIEVLVNIYRKERKEAASLMLYIHNNGKAVVGTYIKSIAEQKLSLTRDVAEKAGYSEFKVTMEKA